MKSNIDIFVQDLKSIINQSKRNAEKLLIDLATSDDRERLINFLKNMEIVFSECPNCFYLMENGYCESCMSKTRDMNKICVVSSVLDAKTIIDKDVFNGTFHVLKGEIDINKNVFPADLKMSELFGRIKEEHTEVIIALNATFKGELTSNYLIQELKGRKFNVSRLARGIPFGGVVNYIDKETIDNAIKNRNNL